MILDIIKHPNDTFLRVSCDKLTNEELASKKYQTLIDNMVPTMYAAQGIGLAAPQIAITKQICIIGKDSFPKKLYINDTLHNKSQDLVLINPSWERNSKKSVWSTEGCLSIPKIFGKVKRYKRIKVNAKNRHGEDISFEASNFFAEVIQHEVDHLHGILFIDKAKDLYETE